MTFCFAQEATKNVSFKTGNNLAVLRFEGWAISDPLTEFLTEELRETIRDLDIFQVQDRLTFFLKKCLSPQLLEKK